MGACEDAPVTTNLTRDEAAARSALITVHRYDVSLDLTSTGPTFTSTTTVRFTCGQPGASTFIDLIADRVGTVELNGRGLDPDAVVDGARIHLSDLAHDNTLTVAADCLYMNTGEGLHRFVDPVDGETYLYSQFEVPDSRRVFTVFEQPDLKAEFAFTVTAPAHWQVISTQPTPHPVPVSEPSDSPRALAAATWTFEPTPRLSSYVTSVIAGPYDVVRDEAHTRAGVVPMAIYCRRSLRPHLDEAEIFDITKRGFAWLEQEFDLAYPFAKYDHIFAPEYNMGAMENVGAVTVSEIYIFRAKVTERIVERRALTILHELAHMWFGDLVTMHWWDDLWLNESFAEWAATAAQAEATRWTDAWTTFALTEKQWAYEQDQLSSTHPVAADMRHLEDVETNFDGITYAKGAAVLKQLVAYVGRDAFREAIRAYFRAHAWGNTRLTDFVTELETASGRDLREWVTLWLETAGVVTLTADVAVDATGRYTRFAVRQSASPAYPTLRPQRVGIGGYTLADGALTRVTHLEVDLDGALTEVPSLVGSVRPDVLLLNDEDLAYAKIRLDDHSRAVVAAAPQAFTSSLPQALVLGAAWDMTREGEMPARQFVQLALDSLPGLRVSALLTLLLKQIRHSVLHYVDPSVRGEWVDLATDRLREILHVAEPASDAQHQLAMAYAAMASRPEDAAYVRSLLDGTDGIDGLQVDTELRWVLVRALAAVGAADHDEVDRELALDPTATGRERAAQALASRPTAAAKAQAWERAISVSHDSNSMLQALGLGFGRVLDPQTLAPFVQPYHDALLSVWRDRTVAVGSIVVEGFYPHALAGPGLLMATQSWLDDHPHAPAGLVRLVAEQRDEVARAVAAQALDAAS